MSGIWIFLHLIELIQEMDFQNGDDHQLNIVMYLLDKLKSFEQKEHFFLKEQNGLGWN